MIPILVLVTACTRGGPGTTNPSSGGEVQSEYLLDPSLNVDLVLDTAEFLALARDDVNGGFDIYVDDDGNAVLPDESWWGETHCKVTFDHELRPVLGTSRVAYAFSRAFMLTGDPTWLDHAEHALDFMYDHGWDRTNGGWHFATDEQGEVVPWAPCDQWDPSRWKWSFAQFYPLLGINAVTEATLGASEEGRRGEHWVRLQDGLAMLEAKLWDDRPDYLGFFDEADLDWSYPRGKGFTGAADGITTHAASMLLQTGEAERRRRLLDLTDSLADRLSPTIASQTTRFGFSERFDQNWFVDDGDKTGFVGHMMKSVWCLARAQVVQPRPAYLEAMETIFEEVWANGGYDHEHGGIYEAFDWGTGEIVEIKNHWNVEQGFTGGITGYHVVRDEDLRARMLEMADTSLDFFMTKMRDPADGVAWTNTAPDGTPTDTRKGHIWKAGYHDAELGYLGYLYGRLYFTGEPVTLHYFVGDGGGDHSMVLNPVEDADLVITDVQLDGAAYPDFDRDTRLLTVPDGVSGVFAVTFELPAR